MEIILEGRDFRNQRRKTAVPRDSAYPEIGRRSAVDPHRGYLGVLFVWVPPALAGRVGCTPSWYGMGEGASGTRSHTCSL